MFQLRNPFYIILPLVFKQSEVVLAKNIAPSFKKQSDRFSKLAATTGKQKLDSKNHFEECLRMIC